MDKLKELREMIELYGTAPTLEEMPRRSLRDKGIYGPTSAHVIEEIHTPFNLAYVAITTGTTAFQNIVGVTHPEIPDRVAASLEVFSRVGINRGDLVLFTYPPLVNVFPRQALDEYGLRWSFLRRSGRDALLLAMCEERPKAVIGESSFLRAALEDARRLDMLELLPKGLSFIAAGTPLDPDFPAALDSVGGRAHDLYGCQEFGWLALDGVPLRGDITLLSREGSEFKDFIVGGLPTGDSFLLSEQGHVLNREGKIITYSRMRTEPDYEVTVLQTTAQSPVTAGRLARSILRIKGKIVRVSPELRAGGDRTILSLSFGKGRKEPAVIDTPEKTRLFDSLLKAQLDYQSQPKTDPSWIKGR